MISRSLRDRLAAMRCLACEHDWLNLADALSLNPVICPNCGGLRTEPVYDSAGQREMPKGWWNE